MKSFKSEINIYRLIWIFMIGSVGGYCVEMLWCYIKNGYFESRQGVLYGPISPVYGVGCVVLTLLLYKVMHKDGFIIFLLSAVIGGVFEWSCSWFQQLTTGTVSWVYSSKSISVGGGRTSIEYCFFWGILGLFFVKEIFPLFQKIINHFKERTVKVWSVIFVVFMIPNVTLSMLAIRREVERIDGVRATTSVDRFLDKHYPNSYMEKVYPNMIFLNKDESEDKTKNQNDN